MQPIHVTDPALAAPHPRGDGPALIAVAVGNAALAFGPMFVRLSDTGPVAAAFWRIMLALPVLGVAAWLARSPGTRAAPPRRLALFLVLAGVAFAADLGSWHVGILGTTLANATLFGNVAIFIFPVWGFFIARTWPSKSQALALLLAVLGAALLMGRSYQLDPRHLLGDLLCVLAGVLYAVYFILMADVRRTMPPLATLAWSSAVSIPPLLLFAIVLGERIVPDDWTPLLALALISQIIGQGCMVYALGRLSPLVMGVALLIQPVVAGTIGWVGFGERLGTADLVGVAMVAVALVLVRREPGPVTATASLTDAITDGMADQMAGKNR